MLRTNRSFLAAIVSIAALTTLSAAGADRDFSGKWSLDESASKLQALPFDPELTLTVEQDTALRCTATTASGTAQWFYKLNGDESIYQVGTESRNSVAKWEGPALLINTLVSGPQSYTVMDRWELSRDGSTLTIRRQISRSTAQWEAQLVYRHGTRPATAPTEIVTPVNPAVPVNPPPDRQPVLITRPEPRPTPAEYTIPAGTHILLSLTNSVSTKNSKDGDHVYLETSVPVAHDGHIVIPRGSYVQGTVTKTKQAGRSSNNKAELYIRFDTLTLPNGVSRDFRSRLTSADSTKGKVDPTEGKVTGDGKDPHKNAEKVGVGTIGGVIVGGAAGHPLAGAGVGALGGLAAVLLSKNQDVVLQRGTQVEMVLDRDISYTAAELRN